MYERESGREGSEKGGGVQWNMGKHNGTNLSGQMSFSEVVVSPISSLFPDLHVKNMK